ncbi:hypothetical protein FHT85_005337 [Rhizobium sp. BK312]|nr:hypothetical protein [Rhizobium sp. BK312]
MACRYGCTSAEIEHWLGHEDQRPVFGSFELQDFRPEPLALKLWARTARLNIAEVETMILSRSARPIDWYVKDCRDWGTCHDCLDEDVSAGRDHYLRREWAYVETAVCRKHRCMLQDWCGHCFTRGQFRFEYIEDGAKLICGHCFTAVTGAQMKIEGPAKTDFLLMVTAAIRAAIEGSKGSVALSEMETAIETLWSSSQADGKPFIAWLDLKLPFGRLPAFTARCNSLATLSLPWRIATFVAAAQLLDVVQARKWFGAPPAYLEREFADRKRKSLPQHAEAPPERVTRIASKLRLKPDVEYQRLAEEILASADWKGILAMKGRVRDRKLGRLMNRALKSEHDSNDAP